jgi:prenylated cyclic peptide (anacyclamide/piricyclamide family)
MKNLKPQQVAPVQREINTTSSAEVGTGMTPLMEYYKSGNIFAGSPFAGDDAE